MSNGLKGYLMFVPKKPLTFKTEWIKYPGCFCGFYHVYSHCFQTYIKS